VKGIAQIFGADWAETPQVRRRSPKAKAAR
jgi:hypothetical protein